MNPYREPGKLSPPACMHCMTSRWMVFNTLFAFWFCDVCGEEPE